MHGLKVTYLIESIYIDENGKTDLKYVTCDIPRGPALEPLLFLGYVNNLQNWPPLLDPIMFAHDTSLFVNAHDTSLFTEPSI